MPEPTLRARFRRSLGYRGWRRTLRIGWRLGLYRLRRGLAAPRPHAFDLEFGTDTVSLTQARTYAGDDGNAHAPPRGNAHEPRRGNAHEPRRGNAHEPIDPVDFDLLMALLPNTFHGFTFIDVGSGQGRALMLAAAFPFTRIVGLEHGLELHRSAERNLARWGRHRARKQDAPTVASIWADAFAWPLPAVSSVYFFSEPFAEPGLRRFIARLAASARQAPRPLFVLYAGDLAWVWREEDGFRSLGANRAGEAFQWRGGPP